MGPYLGSFWILLSVKSGEGDGHVGKLAHLVLECISAVFDEHLAAWMRVALHLCRGLQAPLSIHRLSALLNLRIVPVIFRLVLVAARRVQSTLALALGMRPFWIMWHLLLNLLARLHSSLHVAAEAYHVRSAGPQLLLFAL